MNGKSFLASLLLVPRFAMASEMEVVAPAQERPWSLSLVSGIPEVLGLNLGYRESPFLAFESFYAIATRARVKFKLPSKNLVKKGGFIIKSPDLVLPVDLDLGPQWGFGARIFPFSSETFLSFGLEHRVTSLTSHASSQLIFVDSFEETPSNTLFDAAISSRTEQDLLRLSVGQTFKVFDDTLHFTWFVGATRALRARSKISSKISVSNPEASDPNQIIAEHLAAAEEEQERILRDKAHATIKKYESMTLPLLGLALGLDL